MKPFLASLIFLVLALSPAASQLAQQGAGCSPGVCGSGGSIGIPTDIYPGQQGAFSSGGNSGVTAADAPVGSTILFTILVDAANEAVSSCGDSAGNTYSIAQTTAASGIFGAAICYSINTTHDLPPGGTFTATLGGGAQWYTTGAADVTGANGGLDTSNYASQTNATSTTLSTGTLAQTVEVIFNLSFTGGSSLTTPSGFSGIVSAGNSGFSYDTVASTSSVTAASSWSGGTFNSSQILISLKH